MKAQMNSRANIKPVMFNCFRGTSRKMDDIAKKTTNPKLCTASDTAGLFLEKTDV